VVHPVKDQIDTPSKRQYVRVIDIGNDRIESYAAVDFCQFSPGGNRFGERIRNILLIIENLPLEIAQLDEITVNQPQKTDARPLARPDARPHPAIRHRTSQGAATTQQPASPADPLLPFPADALEEHLAAVTFDVGKHGSGRR